MPAQRDDMMDLLDLRMGDVIRMRRAHPCGGFEWEVVRIGADVGLRCRTCGRRVLMERRTLRRRAKAFVERGAELDPAIREALFGEVPPALRESLRPAQDTAQDERDEGAGDSEARGAD